MSVVEVLRSELSDFCRRYMPVGDEVVIAGLSGGRDSVAMVDALCAVCGSGRVVVVHVDHGLREASEGDARWVVEWAGRLGCRAEVERVLVAERARQEGRGIEVVGREMRRRFYAECQQRHDAAAVFLAHHADDQAETVLGQWLRGAGLDGLAGMAAWEEQGVAGGSRVVLARPWLGIRREEIDAYILERGLDFREDASNALGIYQRNRLRMEALPMLTKMVGRDVVPLLAASAELLRKDAEMLNDLASGAMADVVREGRLSLQPWRELPEALQLRVVRMWLQGHGVGNLSLRLIGEVAALGRRAGAPAKVNLPGGRWVRRTSGVLWIEEG